MDAPKSLSKIFKDKIFRVPDYQRGYAWQESHLRSFWEDLINLTDGRRHYTGVLTLKKNDSLKNDKESNEYWLLKDHSYDMYDIVDGQQRLTTFLIFIQSFIEVIKSLPENENKSEDEIYITDSLRISDIINKYIFKETPREPRYCTYKFGYAKDDPSYNFMKYKIFEEKGGSGLDETLYTLNLKNAKSYFKQQMETISDENKTQALYEIFENATENFVLNEYLIQDDFDVFVSFETMNHRGKKLSDLELLKNRLIYLTSLYQDIEEANRKELREAINETWKVIYYQLGRNSDYPLNDDEFLKAHWIMYFKYSRSSSKAYMKFLLEEHFSPKRCYKKKAKTTTQKYPDELRESEDDDSEDNSMENHSIKEVFKSEDLKPDEILDYVKSLKDSAIHWFNSFFPGSSKNELSKEEKIAINKLNSIGILHFRPLVMAILKNRQSKQETLDVLNEIERHIFISFLLQHNISSHRNTEFYTVAREYDKKEINLFEIIEKLKTYDRAVFDESGKFVINEFFHNLDKLFTIKDGYYSWKGIKYFLYEYELSLLLNREDKKVHLDSAFAIKNLSIEHILPQNSSLECWQNSFKNLSEEELHIYCNSIGNLLLLSRKINSSLYNFCFDKKKNVIYDKDNDNKLRNGYSDGSYSEIEVSEYPNWTPKEIRERSLKLLTFMENRWGISIRNEDKEKLLFFTDNVEALDTTE